MNDFFRTLVRAERVKRNVAPVVYKIHDEQNELVRHGLNVLASTWLWQKRRKECKKISFLGEG